MDVAYDHIQGEAMSPEESKDKQLGSDETSSNLNTEFREAYKAISSSPWGAKLGGLWGSVKKQGESYYTEARKELAAASTEASKGLTDLVNQAKQISLDAPSTVSGGTARSTVIADPNDPSSWAAQTDGTNTPATKEATSSTTTVNELTTDSLIAEAQTLLSRFQTVTSARLKQLQKAEDAADEALERYGRNIRDFLKDAVKVAPPSRDEHGNISSKNVLFESKDAEGKRVVHATRFDAQLHVIHTHASSFIEDPADKEEYESWRSGFDVDTKTDDIAKDLDKYDELRRAMERLVPEQVEYKMFWTRYYFLRHVVETEEQKRRELLKGTQMEQEEVGWGDEDDEEEQAKEAPETSKTPTPVAAGVTTAETSEGAATPTRAAPSGPENDHLKPSESRRSNEHSIADSDASYDILSAATSRGPGTPAPNLDTKEKTKAEKEKGKVVEESDEEDWE